MRRLFSIVVILFSVQSFGFASAEEEPLKTGRYIETIKLSELFDAGEASAFGDIMEPDHTIPFNVYVPENYDPENPPGLLVYVSPTKSGQLPKMWEPVMSQRNLIWVSVSKSGNGVPALRRIVEASISPAFITRTHEIDPERIYVSGFSGGGKISSLVATYYADLFKGAIYICGVRPWEHNPPELFEQIKQNRFVFLSGSQDFNLNQTRQIHRRYQEAGVANIKLMVINNMAHSLPDGEKYNEALSFLDDVAPQPLVTGGWADSAKPGLNPDYAP
ncbi:MAG: hypothetical protein DHS20C05_04650 [Hyphococcus sp.]|nr:MAG: hypothetical protein DHS20C05_04650 [Marinicaulis sp.]